MRGLKTLAFASAAVALTSASIAAPLRSRHAFGHIVLGGGAIGETQEERQRRNAKAGGRDKRIARNKARRAYSYPRRRSSAPRTLRFGRLFKSDKREATFTRYLEVGLTRNEAAKLARRVAA